MYVSLSTDSLCSGASFSHTSAASAELRASVTSEVRRSASSGRAVADPTTAPGVASVVSAPDVAIVDSGAERHPKERPTTMKNDIRVRSRAMALGLDTGRVDEVIQ